MHPLSPSRAATLLPAEGSEHERVIMPVSDAILDVYEAGPTTVVGFGNRRVLDDINLALCREELVKLLPAARRRLWDLI